MISKKEIQKFAKKILRRQRGLRDHQIIHPQREWVIGLVSAVIVIIVIAVWSSTTYLAITDRSIDTSISATDSQTVYRTEVVNVALEQFRERTDNFDQLLENRVVVPAVPDVPESLSEDEQDEGESDIVTDEVDEPEQNEDIEPKPEAEEDFSPSLSP